MYFSFVIYFLPVVISTKVILQKLVALSIFKLDYRKHITHPRLESFDVYDQRKYGFIFIVQTLRQMILSALMKYHLSITLMIKHGCHTC